MRGLFLPTSSGAQGKAPVSRERPKARERAGSRGMEAAGDGEKVRVRRRSQPDGAERETAHKAARAHARRSTGAEVARKQVSFIKTRASKYQVFFRQAHRVCQHLNSVAVDTHSQTVPLKSLKSAQMNEIPCASP